MEGKVAENIRVCLDFLDGMLGMLIARLMSGMKSWSSILSASSKMRNWRLPER